MNTKAKTTAADKSRRQPAGKRKLSHRHFNVTYQAISDTEFFVRADGILICCVACGKPCEHTAAGLRTHKCSPRADSGKRGAAKRIEELGSYELKRTFAQRLADGFELLEGCDD